MVGYIVLKFIRLNVDHLMEGVGFFCQIFFIATPENS
jgi:hypothetical protein